jgi:hypothetical protein
MLEFDELKRPDFIELRRELGMDEMEVHDK